MKNFTKLLLGSLVLFSLSGCTAGDMITMLQFVQGIVDFAMLECRWAKHTKF